MGITLYQIRVEGDSSCFDSKFIMRSKDVYFHKPTESEVNQFIEKCKDDSYFDFLQGEPTSVSLNELVLNITDDDELSKEIKNILKKYADPKTAELIDKVLKKK